MEGAAIGGLLCALVVGLLIGTLIGAIILRAAVSLYNKMAGGPAAEAAVPEPEFGKAMGITFVTTLVNMVAGFLIGLVIGGAAAAGGADPQSGALLAQLVSLPVSALIMAGMLTLMLPTTFGRGILVTLCYFAIAIAIGIVLFGIFMLVSVVLLAS